MAEMQPIDYGRSFVCTTGPGNALQFWVESRCRVIDEETDAAMDFYQCGSCKSEDTFAERDLFQQDNYNFLPVFGEDASFAIFRRKAYLYDEYATFGGAGEGPWPTWGSPLFKTTPASPLQLLDTSEKIREATLRPFPLIAQTALWNTETQMRAIIEYPVKTMNTNAERNIYQVDTGPVVLPDLTRRYDRPVESLRVAFVAFNVPDFADFVIEQPTPIVENGREICKVHHYSVIQSLETVNTLWCIGEL